MRGCQTCTHSKNAARSTKLETSSYLYYTAHATQAQGFVGVSLGLHACGGSTGLCPRGTSTQDVVLVTSTILNPISYLSKSKVVLHSSFSLVWRQVPWKILTSLLSIEDLLVRVSVDALAANLEALEEEYSTWIGDMTQIR